jgi:hypothetical protein
MNNVVPLMNKGGNGSVQTAASGVDFVALPAQPCRQVTIANNTGAALEVQQGGAGVALPVFDQTYFTFYGLTDASQLGVRRVDQGVARVTVTYRWEG